MNLDDMNYYGDHRVIAGLRGDWFQSFNEAKMTAEVRMYGADEDEDEEEIVMVPCVFEVCGICDGKGSHVNPNIDAGGLTRDDFADDPDFETSYFSGRYDVSCNECKGRRVVPEPNYGAMTKEDAERLQQHLQDEADAAYEHAQELRYGY